MDNEQELRGILATGVRVSIRGKGMRGLSEILDDLTRSLKRAPACRELVFRL